MARRKKTTEETPAEVPANNSDDNFGLPDIEYQPLNRDAAPEPEAQPEPERQPVFETAGEEQVQNNVDSQVSLNQYERSTHSYESSYSENETTESGSIIPKIAGIIVVVMLALGATWYFAVYKPKKDAEEKALSEKNRKDAEAKEQARLAEERRLAEEKRLAAEEALKNATPKEGTIETLTDRTGRYYVVAASSIDADLVMDYAKKLSAKGVSSKIIPPYGKVKFSRLTIAEGDTYAATQALADGMKGEYTDALWVIKY